MVYEKSSQTTQAQYNKVWTIKNTQTHPMSHYLSVMTSAAKQLQNKDTLAIIHKISIKLDSLNCKLNLHQSKIHCSFIIVLCQNLSFLCMVYLHFIGLGSLSPSSSEWLQPLPITVQLDFFYVWNWGIINFAVLLVLALWQHISWQFQPNITATALTVNCYYRIVRLTHSSLGTYYRIFFSYDSVIVFSSSSSSSCSKILSTGALMWRLYQWIFCIFSNKVHNCIITNTSKSKMSYLLRVFVDTIIRDASLLTGKYS